MYTKQVFFIEICIFWIVKGLVLLAKRTPFKHQKDSFCNAKGLHLKTVGFNIEQNKQKH